MNVIIELYVGTSVTDWGKITPTSGDYDWGDYILDKENIEIDERVDFDGTFNYSVSSVNLEVLPTAPGLSTYFSESNLQLNTREYGCWIKVSGTAYFYGRIDKESVYYDNETNRYNFIVVDWFKFIMEKMKFRIIPNLNPNYNLSNFLSNICSEFATGTPNINISPYSENLSSFDYATYCYPDGIKVSHMIMEMQKAFGCYFFINPDKEPCAVNRTQYLNATAKDINNNLLESGYIKKYYTHPTYDSILVNVTSSTGSWSYSGWVLFYMQDGVETELSVNADLGNIPASLNYLDLRQILVVGSGESEPNYSFTTLLFDVGTPTEKYNTYKPVLAPMTYIECSVNRIDINIFDKVTIDRDYLVIAVKKNLLTNISKLELNYIE